MVWLTGKDILKCIRMEKLTGKYIYLLKVEDRKSKKIFKEADASVVEGFAMEEPEEGVCFTLYCGELTLHLTPYYTTNIVQEFDSVNLLLITVDSVYKIIIDG